MIKPKVIKKRGLNVSVAARVQVNEKTGKLSLIVTATIGGTVAEGTLNPQFNPDKEYTQAQFQIDLDKFRERLAAEAAHAEKIRTFSGKLK